MKILKTLARIFGIIALIYLTADWLMFSNPLSRMRSSAEATFINHCIDYDIDPNVFRGPYLNLLDEDYVSFDWISRYYAVDSCIFTARISSSRFGTDDWTGRGNWQLLPGTSPGQVRLESLDSIRQQGRLRKDAVYHDHK